MTTNSRCKVTFTQPKDPVADSTSSPLPKSPELEKLLTKVQNLLENEDPNGALALLARAKITSPWVTNAIGVCQLRLGNIQAAISLFRDIALCPNGIILRNDIPLVFKSNFATALLLSNNLSGCQRVLAEIRGHHEAGSRLSEAIHRSIKGLTRWQVFCWYLGFVPRGPVPLDFPPGDLD